MLITSFLFAARQAIIQSSFVFIFADHYVQKIEQQSDA